MAYTPITAYDNPEPHIEGSIDCRVVTMRISPEALARLGTAMGMEIGIADLPIADESWHGDLKDVAFMVPALP